LENLLHAENVAQKKINSDEHFARSFSFMAVKGKLRNQKERDHTYTNPSLNNERKNHESANSVQKNTNSASSHRNRVRRARVAYSRARGRGDRLERDRLDGDRDERRATAASVGTALCDGAGGGI